MGEWWFGFISFSLNSQLLLKPGTERSIAVYMIGLFTLSAALRVFQIPNFLHLTPAAIKKHCEALKCNPFI